MKATPLLLFLPTLPRLVAAQETINLFSIIVSEANSVYTQVNSILSSAASAASAAAASATATSSTDDASTTSESTSSSISDTSTSSSDASSSSFPSSTSASSSFPSSTSASLTSSSSSSTSSYASPAFGSIDSSTTSVSSTSHVSSHSSSRTPSSSITSSSTSSGSIVGTSSVLGAAAETSTSVPASSGSSHHSNLAIILGCVLGALALGFFILALVLCCKRRRRGSSPRHSALSADDDVDAWRETQVPGVVPIRGSARHGRNVSGTAPLMTEHPAYRNDAAHQNPFVPVPPPPRRSAPHSRSDLTNDIAPGDNPFVDGAARPSSIRSISSTSSSHHKVGIAAGIAAAAAGATLVHQHKKHKEEEATLMHEKAETLPGVRRQVSRKPVPVSHVNNGEQWPYNPVSPIDSNAETAALVKTPTRGSGESRRIFNRDAARANAAFDQQYAPQDAPHNHGDHGHALATGAAGLAAGAVGGAALAHHRDQERRRSRSSSSSNSNRRSRPPLAASGNDSDQSNSTGSSGDSRNSRGYSDALASQPQETEIPPQHDLYGVPAAPPSRSRRNSAHGAALPGAAAFTYANRPTIPSPLSSEIRHDHGYSPPRSQTRRSSSAPRYSFPYEPMDHEYGAYPPFPGASGNHGYSNALQNEAFPSLPDDQVPANPDKAIVGDNGYPHMNIPRRKSGGEYDHTETGPLGPQIIPVAPRTSEEGSSRNTTMKTLGSDDSTWRMSQGMPGGWQRASLDSPRNSRDLGNRDSGVGMNAGRRRLRVSDITGREDGGGLGQAL